MKQTHSWQNGCLCVYDSESGTEPSNACASFCLLHFATTLPELSHANF